MKTGEEITAWVNEQERARCAEFRQDAANAAFADDLETWWEEQVGVLSGLDKELLCECAQTCRRVIADQWDVDMDFAAYREMTEHRWLRREIRRSMREALLSRVRAVMVLTRFEQADQDFQDASDELDAVLAQPGDTSAKRTQLQALAAKVVAAYDHRSQFQVGGMQTPGYSERIELLRSISAMMRQELADEERDARIEHARTALAEINAMVTASRLCVRCGRRDRHFDDLCKRCANELGVRPTGPIR